jgi:hypothetical protein
LSRVSVVLLVSFVTLFVGFSLADAIVITPDRIVLNSVQGNAEDIQAIIPMTIDAGYSFAEGSAILRFGEDIVASSIYIRYCYIDNNLLISFDKTALLNNPIVIEMVGSTVAATVEGSFTAIDIDGNTYTQSFSGTDQVIILDQGKNNLTK